MILRLAGDKPGTESGLEVLFSGLVVLLSGTWIVIWTLEAGWMLTTTWGLLFLGVAAFVPTTRSAGSLRLILAFVGVTALIGAAINSLG